jgi:hypothetical protein
VASGKTLTRFLPASQPESYFPEWLQNMSIQILMITCAVSISSGAFAVNDGVTDANVAQADSQCTFDGKPLMVAQDQEQTTEKELPLSLKPEPRSSEEWWTQRHV